jgi:transcriptional regulator
MACSSHSDLSVAPIIVGGYQSVEISDEIKTAALFALQTQTKIENKPFELIEIKKATQQVVAGMNYQFELTVKSGENLRHAAVIVFRGLDSQYSLSAWRWLADEQ